MASSIVVRVLGDASQFNRTMGQVDKKAGGLKSKFDGLGSKIKGALAGAGIVGGVALLKDATQAAIEDEQAQAKLAQTLKRTAGASDAQVKSVEKWISKTALASGVADDDLRPALANLVTATGDVTKSQGLMSTALDIAARTGKPVEEVTKSLAQAYVGNTTRLKKYGIQTKDAAGKAISFEEAQRRLNEKFGGASAAAMNTTAGKMARLKVQFDETKEAVGARLLPILGKLAEIFVKHQKLILTIVGALVGMVVITKIVNMVKAFRAAMLGLNLAFAANPVVLIVAGIVALIAAVVIAYQKVGWFRDAVNATGRALASVGQAIWGALKAAFDFLIGLIQRAIDTWVTIYIRFPARVVGALANLGKTIWGGIVEGLRWLRGAFGRIIDTYITLYVRLPARIITGIGNLGGKVWNGISQGLRWLRDRFHEAVSWLVEKFKALPGRVLSGLGNIGRAIWGGVRDGLNWLRDTFGTKAGEIAGKFFDGIKNGLKGVAGFAGDVADGVIGVVKDAWNAVAKMINDFVPDKIGWGPFSLNLPDNPIPTFHDGGVFDPRGREGLAMLRKGEGVFTPEQMRALGSGGGAINIGSIVLGNGTPASLVNEFRWYRITQGVRVRRTAANGR